MFFFPAFYMLLQILLSAIRATISATTFLEGKKNEKKPSVFCTLFFYRRPIVPL